MKDHKPTDPMNTFSGGVNDKNPEDPKVNPGDLPGDPQESPEEPKKVVTPHITAAEMDAMAKKAGEEIKATQKSVKIKIPFDKLNPKDSIVPVCINGYIWQIERGKEVEVPENVKTVLEGAGYL